MKEQFKRLVNAMYEYELISEGSRQYLLNVPHGENWEMDEWDWLMETYYRELDSTLINSILEAANEAFTEDAEASQVPPPYENYLIPSLFKFLELDKSSLKVNLNYKRKENMDDEYLLTIEYEGKAYKKVLIDAGDYFDVDGTIQLLNSITTNLKEPFKVHNLNTNDQSFCYFKGDIEKLNAFLKNYNHHKY